MRGIPQIPIQSNILGRYWNEFDPWRPYSYCLLDLALTPQGSVVSGPGGRSFRHDLVLQVNIPGKCRNMSDPWRPRIATNRTQRICYHALVPDFLSGPVSMPRCQGQVMDWTCLRMPHISSSLSIFSTVWQRTLSSQGHCHRGVTGHGGCTWSPTIFQRVVQVKWHPGPTISKQNISLQQNDQSDSLHLSAV